MPSEQPNNVCYKSTEDNLKAVLRTIFNAADELTALLKPYETLIDRSGLKRLAECGIKDKIALAQLIIELKKGN